MLPRLYFSRPATVLPETAMDNDAVVARVRESFRGTAREFAPIERAIRFVFDRCNTKMRYLEEDWTLSPGEFAARAAAACLEENGVAVSDLDLVIYGGVARDAFEPATATEVAGRLGATPVIAFDVTGACAGLLEAMHIAAGYFAIHDDIDTALICSGELTRERISYDIQNFDDLAVKFAGLTLGNAAAAVLITRDRLAPGGARLLAMTHKSLPEHYALCSAPIDGHFMSHSHELFALSVHVDPVIRSLLTQVDWTPQDVDHYALHQPTEAALEAIFEQLGANPRACVHTHSMFGNTVSTSWTLALDSRLRSGTVEDGDKIVIGTAAAGFTMVAAAAEWESGEAVGVR